MTAGAAGREVLAVTGGTLLIPVAVAMLTQSISRQTVTSFCQGIACGESTAVQLVSRSPFACTVEATWSQKRLGPMLPVPVLRHLRCIFSQVISIRAGVTYTATARIATSARSFAHANGVASASCSGVTVTFKSNSSKDSNGSSQSRGQIPVLIFRSSHC